MEDIYLSTCISPCPVDSLSSGRLPTGIHVFSRAVLTLYGLTIIPSAYHGEKQQDLILHGRSN